MRPPCALHSRDRTRLRQIASFPFLKISKHSVA